jgi:hypothetical protein
LGLRPVSPDPYTIPAIRFQPSDDSELCPVSSVLMFQDLSQHGYP